MENSSLLVDALVHKFERHRIVFWYNTDSALRQNFELIEIPGVVKIELANNEFGVKYRILRLEPDQKFLLYHEGPRPPDVENWLLDVFLAQGEFRAGQTGLWLAELGLGLEFTDVVQNHSTFFEAARRREALKSLIKPDDTARDIRLKMLAVCSGVDPHMNFVLMQLFMECAEGKQDRIKLIARCQLDTFLWEQVKRIYGYKADKPGIQDLSLEIFRTSFAMATGNKSPLTREAMVFLKSWMDSNRYNTSFEYFSKEAEKVLGIEQSIANEDFSKFIELDYFRCIDRKIISDTVDAVTKRTVSSNDVCQWVRQRRCLHWYKDFEHIYEAIACAAQFLNHLHKTSLSMESLADGVRRYSQRWFRIDQLYREYIFHFRKCNESTFLFELTSQIENLYNTKYLLAVNDQWQFFVDNAKNWSAPPIHRQDEFYELFVAPFLRRDNKVFVIISDALRYEVAEELSRRITAKDRYEAEIEPLLSMLPSYTQLGMAALLPHQKIELTTDDSGTVIVDAQSSQGTPNRTKILNAFHKEHNACAITANDFLAMPREGDQGYRAFFRKYDVVYIYHNRIDAVGGKRDTEESTFDASEQALSELEKLIKKLASANATNMLVTADHGFIYQHRPIEESDFSNVEPEGERIFMRDRRFVLGAGLKQQTGMRKFTSCEVGLDGDVEIQIPKSINRLRLRGSGSRFVHGGASLQEVVIPVVKINKKRQSDLSVVDIELFRGASSVISSGQLTVTLYQSSPASDKVRPRLLNAGIFNMEGELISDSHDIIFDFTSENPRERETRVTFTLSRKADEENNRDVILKLREKYRDTNEYVDYKTLSYTVRRMFTSDFDF
jgi:uncharacterized protein (TIGR02687 family)